MGSKQKRNHPDLHEQTAEPAPLQETTAFHRNGTVVVDGAQAFYNVLQFPDISRPVVSLEELQNIRVNGNDVCIMFGIIFFE